VYPGAGLPVNIVLEDQVIGGLLALQVDAASETCRVGLEDEVAADDIVARCGDDNAGEVAFRDAVALDRVVVRVLEVDEGTPTELRRGGAFVAEIADGETADQDAIDIDELNLVRFGVIPDQNDFVFLADGDQPQAVLIVPRDTDGFPVRSWADQNCCSRAGLGDGFLDGGESARI